MMVFIIFLICAIIIYIKIMSANNSQIASPKRLLDAVKSQALNVKILLTQQVSDGDKASNFEALHEKISGTEERLADINEQTQKKFQIVRENVTTI